MGGEQLPVVDRGHNLTLIDPLTGPSSEAWADVPKHSGSAGALPLDPEVAPDTIEHRSGAATPRLARERREVEDVGSPAGRLSGQYPKKFF